MTEDHDEWFTALGRLGEERFDHRSAGAGALVLGPHGTGRKADPGNLTDEAPREHGVGDDLTVEDANERQTFDPIAGRAEGVDEFCLVNLAESSRRQRVDRVDVAGSLWADGEPRCGRIRHPHTIAIGEAASVPSPAH